MGFIQGLVAFVGRIFLSVLFLSSGIDQILDWQGSEQLMTAALHDWVTLTAEMGYFQDILSLALSSTSILLGAAIFCQLAGGLCVLLGMWVRFGAFLLAAFLIPVMILFNHFWLLQGPDRQMEMAEFMKNLSILGGVFILLAYGNGMRHKRGSSQSEPS